jgi:hypothetical protein
MNDPARSAPTLPVAETSGVVGQPSGYLIPDDPRAPIVSPPPAGSAESAARPSPLPEVPGTIDGACRSDPATIGPMEAGSGFNTAGRGTTL